MKNRLTIFCGGTSENSKTSSIMSRFYASLKSKNHYHYIAGPQTRIKYKLFDKNEISFDPTGIRQIESDISDTVDLILRQIENGTLQEEADGFYRVNLVGYSRGAVTCMRIAHALAKKNPKIKLNIYGLDPVAGLSDKADKEARVIPANVEHYVPVFQIDEMRQGFKPEDHSRWIVEDLTATSVTPLLLYGPHNGTSKIRREEKMQEAVELGWYLLDTFLSQHDEDYQKKKQNELPVPIVIKKKKNGKKIYVEKTIKKESYQGLLEKYAILKLDRKAYQKAGQDIRLKDGMPFLAAQPRSMLNSLDDYVIEPAIFDSKGNLIKGFFVNRHERELFKKTYPYTFNYLFEKGRLDREDETTGYRINYTKINLRIELAKMKSENNQLFQSLKKHRQIQENATDDLALAPPPNIIFPKPMGVSRIETCYFLDRKKLSGLDLLEAKIKQACSIYLRGKSRLAKYGERSQHEIVLEMKEEIREILNSELLDKHKRQECLRCLRKYSLYLRGIKSDSELGVSLEKILSDEGYQYQPKKTGILNKAVGMVGRGIRAVGSVVKYVGEVVHTVSGSLTGFFVEDLSRRTHEVIDAEVSSESRMVKGLGVASTLISAVGRFAKFIFGGLTQIGDAIKGLGNIMIDQSGAYQGKFVKPIKQQPIMTPIRLPQTVLQQPKEQPVVVKNSPPLWKLPRTVAYSNSSSIVRADEKTPKVKFHNKIS